MSSAAEDPGLFITWAYSNESFRHVQLMIDSIRKFGGEFLHCPVWVFVPETKDLENLEFKGQNIEIKLLDTPDSIRNYYYGNKVYACARAEELVGQDVRSLVWVSPEILFVNPPALFDLVGDIQAAFRPVHIQNVGLRVDENLDTFWSGVYRGAGVKDIDMELESYVDRVQLRAYFNSAAFGLDPALGLCRKWFDLFEELVTDAEFQRKACQDGWHQVFLHQAVLSALVAARVRKERLLILPPEYVYPYNLHGDVPLDRKAHSLDELVCLFYEGRSLIPEEVTDIKVTEPYKSWLASFV